VSVWWEKFFYLVEAVEFIERASLPLLVQFSRKSFKNGIAFLTSVGESASILA
jgi:hypothetical protein